ncbi:hypothetical protein HYT60_01610 [Candidatus Woesebacteria bacterium]|nr:hypothetical protein [Candidatus Woesebacteria bacterium]
MEVSDLEEVGFRPEYNFKEQVQDLTSLIEERATEDIGSVKLIIKLMKYR